MNGEIVTHQLLLLDLAVFNSLYVENKSISNNTSQKVVLTISIIIKRIRRNWYNIHLKYY